VIIGLSAPNRTPEAGAVQTIFIKMSPAADSRMLLKPEGGNCRAVGYTVLSLRRSRGSQCGHGDHELTKRNEEEKLYD
jgi:hypothetical protein